MRLKLGRPDLSEYADHFDVPEAGVDDLAVTFLGVSTLLFDDGVSAFMTDGFLSRPGLASVGLGRIAPNGPRIADGLCRAGVQRLAAVVPVHTHFDHALDSAVVAARTGAALVGGESAANIGRGQGLAEDRIAVAEPGRPMQYGAYELTLVGSRHCPPDRFPGTIDEPLRPPAKASAYRCGEAWSVLVSHESGRTALVQGSAGFVEGALAGIRADVAYLGVGQLGLQPDDYLESYWRETVGAVGARRVVLIHWDDFFRPLTKALWALPYAGDDLDHSWEVLSRLAVRDGVRLHFPRVFERENPWAD